MNFIIQLLEKANLNDNSIIEKIYSEIQKIINDLSKNTQQNYSEQQTNEMET